MSLSACNGWKVLKWRQFFAPGWYHIYQSSTYMRNTKFLWLCNHRMIRIRNVSGRVPAVIRTSPGFTKSNNLSHSWQWVTHPPDRGTSCFVSLGKASGCWIKPRKCWGQNYQQSRLVSPLPVFSWCRREMKHGESKLEVSSMFTTNCIAVLALVRTSVLLYGMLCQRSPFVLVGICRAVFNLYNQNMW